MSPFVWARWALSSQTSFLAAAGFLTLLLFIVAAARSYLSHYAAPPLPITPWVPIPADLPTEPVPPYGAPALKRHFRAGVAGGVGGSAALHLAVIAGIVIVAGLTRSRIIGRISPPPPVLDSLRVISPPPPIAPEPVGSASHFIPYVPLPNRWTIPIPVPDSQAPRQTFLEFSPDAGLGDNSTSIWGSPWGGRGGKGSQESLLPGLPERGEETVPLNLVEVLPALVTMPRPDYPPLAYAAEVEGTVRLNVLVGRDGKVHGIRVTESVPMLDDAARLAAGQAVFTPARLQNRPVAVWVEMPIRFSLRDP